MFNIAQYLEKFKNFGQSEKRLKELILLVVKEVSNIDLEEKNITLKNGEIIFTVSPAIKNTIYIKKNIILSKIKEKSESIINDIR